MIPLSRNLVVLFADVLAHPGVPAACARLTQEGYEIAVVGAPAPAALQALDGHGVKVGVHAGAPLEALAGLSPAVVAFAATAPPQNPHIPHRLCLAAQSPDPGSLAVEDLLAWVEDYLAPRVPRTCFQRTSS